MEKINLPTPKYSQKINIMKNTTLTKKKKEKSEKFIDYFYDDKFLDSYFSHIKLKKIL